MEETKEEINLDSSLSVSLSPAVIKGKIALDMTKVHGNYNQLIKGILETEITEENFQEGQALLKRLISLLSYSEDHRKAEKNPYLEAGKVIDAAHKEFSKPIEDAKNRLQEKLNAVGRKIEAEAQRARQEKDRIASLVNLVNQFILDSSVKIASADTNEQLIQIERLINLEKANKSKYQDHLPLLIERCNELTSKIKEQKDLIRKKEALEKKQKEAYEAGNDEKAMELQNEAEFLGAKIHENTIVVQESASKSVILAEIVPPEIDMPNTRRKIWKFEMIEAKEVMKKSPELLKVELDFKKTSEVLKTLKDTGVLAGKSEYILNGIRYFEEKNF